MSLNYSIYPRRNPHDPEESIKYYIVSDPLSTNSFDDLIKDVSTKTSLNPDESNRVLKEFAKWLAKGYTVELGPIIDRIYSRRKQN